MFENLVAYENLPFLISLGALLLIVIIETVSLLIGGDVFGFLDSGMPDVGVDVDPGLEVDPSAAAVGSGVFHHLLAIFHLGKVPAIFSLMSFLFIFPFVGYNLQLLLVEVGVGRLPLFLATPAAFFPALLGLRWANQLLARILPRDETTAVSGEELIGRVAVITIGTVTHTRQSEARTEDQYKHHHYVQVIADNEGDTFRQGDHVLLAGRRGSLYTVIAVRNPNLEELSSPS